MATEADAAYWAVTTTAAKKQKKYRFMGRELPQRSCRKSLRDFDPPSPFSHIRSQIFIPMAPREPQARFNNT
jgi:hypothetical protein